MAEITINAGVTKIDYPTAYALIESGKCILLDIREKNEFESGFIPGAIHLSLNEMTLENTKKVAPDFATPLIIYCRTGRRTIEAGKKLKQMGYYYILDMGGISNWPYEKEFPQNSN